MSKPKPGALFIQAWVSEMTGVTRRPSWIARRMSTRPPTPSVAPSAPTGDSAEPRDRPSGAPIDGGGVADGVSTPPALPQPPPRGAVDLPTSMALVQLADENAALREQITDVAARMARLQREVLEASEEDLVRLALTIAGRVVGRELAIDPGLVVGWARQAIEALAAKDGVVIAVAKDVRDQVSGDDWKAVGVDHRVQTDPQLAPGAIEVRTPEGTIATGPDARLAAVATALGVGEP